MTAKNVWAKVNGEKRLIIVLASNEERVIYNAYSLDEEGSKVLLGKNFCLPAESFSERFLKVGA